MTEEVIYSDNHVRVTDFRVSIQGNSFILRDIKGVRMVEQKPPRSNYVVALTLCCIWVICMLYFVMVYPSWLTVLAVLAGVAFFTLTVMLMFSKLNSKFLLVISLEAGDVNAFESEDSQYIESGVKAINGAIAQLRSMK